MTNFKRAPKACQKTTKLINFAKIPLQVHCFEEKLTDWFINPLNTYNECNGMVR